MDITASLLLADTGAVLIWGVRGGSHLDVIGVILIVAGIIVFIAPVVAGSRWDVLDRVRSRGGKTVLIEHDTVEAVL